MAVSSLKQRLLLPSLIRAESACENGHSFGEDFDWSNSDAI